jgi:hypothetical protein
MTVANALATVAKLQGCMTHFIKYKDEIINLNLVALITKTNEEKNLGFDYYWKE